MQSTTITIFTDGSAICNGKKGCRAGIGIYADKYIEYSEDITKQFKHVSNQVAELYACIKALLIIEKFNIKPFIIIYTDSQYVIKSMISWIKKWKLNGWKNATGKEIANIDLIKQLDTLVTKFNVCFKHVRSHQIQPTDPEEFKVWYGNEKADTLAKKAIS